MFTWSSAHIFGFNRVHLAVVVQNEDGGRSLQDDFKIYPRLVHKVMPFVDIILGAGAVIALVIYGNDFGISPEIKFLVLGGAGLNAFLGLLNMLIRYNQYGIIKSPSAVAYLKFLSERKQLVKPNAENGQLGAPNVGNRQSRASMLEEGDSEPTRMLKGDGKGANPNLEST